MTRQHKSQHYESADLRSLQAQINELWGAVTHLIDHPPMPIGVENEKIMREVLAEETDTGPFQIYESAAAELEAFYANPVKDAIFLNVTDEDEVEISREEYIADLERRVAIEAARDAPCDLVTRPHIDEKSQRALSRLQAVLDAPIPQPHGIDHGPELTPQADVPNGALWVHECGYGWYQVVDCNGAPIHEGKLRKGPAEALREKTMQSAE